MVEQTRFPAQPGEQRRLLVVTPVFNEEPNLEAVAAAMAAQTRRPDRWIVVDDGSTDGTRTLLSRLEAELDFMRGLGLPRDDRRNLDGLASAREARAFNIGLASSDGPWDYVAKVDGDMVLPARYFEVLLDRFGRCPELGLAGGRYAELRQDRRWHTVSIPAHCVPGALKTYRADCLARIGGVQEQLAWDTIDEMDARRHGFATRSFPDLEARHLRATGAGAGVLRGRARHGACAWITHYPTYFVVLRALKQATFPPRVLSGAAFLWGYAAAAVRATPRVPDEDFRRHVRGELRRRLLRRPLRPVVEAAT